MLQASQLARGAVGVGISLVLGVSLAVGVGVSLAFGVGLAIAVGVSLALGVGLAVSVDIGIAGIGGGVSPSVGSGAGVGFSPDAIVDITDAVFLAGQCGTFDAPMFSLLLRPHRYGVAPWAL